MLKVFARAFEGFGCSTMYIWDSTERPPEMCSSCTRKISPGLLLSLIWRSQDFPKLGKFSRSLALPHYSFLWRQTELETQWPMKMMIIHRDPTTVKCPSRASSERGHESSEAFGGPTEIRFNRGHSSVLLCIQSGWAPLGLSDTAIRSYSYNYISD